MPETSLHNVQKFHSNPTTTTHFESDCATHAEKRNGHPNIFSPTSAWIATLTRGHQLPFLWQIHALGSSQSWLCKNFGQIRKSELILFTNAQHSNGAVAFNHRHSRLTVSVECPLRFLACVARSLTKWVAVDGFELNFYTWSRTVPGIRSQNLSLISAP